MIYFDNAATTFPKPQRVIRAVEKCIKEYCANHGRSTHRLALRTSEKIYETREKIAGLLGVKYPEYVVFTENATHALNLAIKTTVNPGSHVIISDMEHNSVFRPIYALSEKAKVTYSVFNTDGDISEKIEKLITPKTECIVSSLMSNVTGKEISLEALSYAARKNNIKLILDASQCIGHKKIDFDKFPFDILCAPSHKSLFGIQGAGFAVFTDGALRKTLYEGGSGNDSKSPNMPTLYPERFEAGTLPAPSIISMMYGIEFIESIGIDSINKRLSILTERATEMITSINGARVYQYGNGIVSFTLPEIPVYSLSYELDKRGICTRSGLHCAPLAHKSLGTDETGTLRISFSVFNRDGELDSFYKALREIAKGCS